MEWFTPIGWACILLAAFGAIGAVAVYRADSARGGRGILPLAAMVTIGVLAPILLLAGVVLVMTGNSDSFGR